MDGAMLSYSDWPLLNEAQLFIELGEKICIVGRNGMGKSTLLKVLNGQILIDSGNLCRQQGLTTAFLQQDPPKDLDMSVLDYVLSGQSKIADIYKTIDESDDAELHARFEEADGYGIIRRAKETLRKLSIDSESSMSGLSGGQLRRVALVRAIASEPQLLLLDEPTNHMDISSIVWLQNFVTGYRGAVVFISHDRAFIDACANKIVELDRGKLYSYPGNFATYIRNRDCQLEIESKANADFDKKLAQEEIWIRQGIKARRTRNEGRVRALIKMREERKQRYARKGNIKTVQHEAENSGKDVYVCERISLKYGDRDIINQTDVHIMRGDKIALVGNNGAGKTSFINMLLGNIKPTTGKIKIGANVEVAYFDQYREQLDEEATVLNNLTHGKTEVVVNGKPRHVISYLQDFLFEPKKLNTPAKALSGGEKNRLMLAKLFLKSFNVLILDEPTNDLDMETLELLEEMLCDYKATLIIVSHDRAFVSNVAEEIIYFDGTGRLERIIGSYDDLQKLLNDRKNAQLASAKPASAKSDSQAVVKQAKPKTKLSYNENKELESLPGKIETLEESLDEMRTAMSDPSFFSASADVIKAETKKLQDLENELAACYERWEELEGLKKQYER